jgi:NAD(P)-dependent dehydrogenase (short-subunit alcohol dehydrogenase family)
MASEGRLSGKVALITGAGSGMGLAMTKLFAAQGAQVSAIARKPEALKALSEIKNVRPIRADVGIEDDVNRMVDETESHFGKLDIICNTAGIHDQLYPLHETSNELWDRLLNTDLRGPFQILRRAIPGMMKRRSGSIINVSSVAAYQGLHGPSYSAAKAGLIGMSISIAVRYFELGIRCNVICPGSTRTNITETSGGHHPDGMRVITEICGKNLARWQGDAEDVAETALFLASDAAKHVNGVTIPVDGGMSVS